MHINTRIRLVVVHTGRLGRRVWRVGHCEGVAGRVRHLEPAAVDTVEPIEIGTGRVHRLIRDATVRREPAHGDLSLSRVGWGSLSAVVRTTGIMLLNLGLEAAAIRSISDSRKDRPDSLHDLVLRMASRVLQCRLNNIVAEGVSEEALHLSRDKKFLSHHVLRSVRGTA